LKGIGFRTIVEYPLSAARVQQILDNSAELNVFLTALLAPYVHIHINLLTEGREFGVYEQNEELREIRVSVCLPYITPKPTYFYRQKPGFGLSHNVKLFLKELVLGFENRAPEAAYQEIENNLDRYAVCVGDSWSLMTIREYMQLLPFE
jgi:hypothetical protein